MFVDFDLDPTGPVPVDTTEAAGETVSLAYAARYSADSDGTITEAEKLDLQRADPTEPWQIIDVESTHTVAARNDALTTIEVYFAALLNGDYTAAAALAAPAPSIDGRDDRGRLTDEGFLTGMSAAAIAGALELWCESRPECAATPGVEIEVAASHSLRAIATYEGFRRTMEPDRGPVSNWTVRVGLALDDTEPGSLHESDRTPRPGQTGTEDRATLNRSTSALVQCSIIASPARLGPVRDPAFWSACPIRMCVRNPVLRYGRQSGFGDAVMGRFP